MPIDKDALVAALKTIAGMKVGQWNSPFDMMREVSKIASEALAASEQQPDGGVEPYGYVDKLKQKFASHEAYSGEFLLKNGWTAVYAPAPPGPDWRTAYKDLTFMDPEP